MRKIDLLAQEKFNGDTLKAIEYLVINKEPTFGEYVQEFTKKEATFAFRALHTYHVDKIIEEDFGGKEKFADDVVREINLQELNLTAEEVKNAEKNPFRAKLGKDVLKLALLEGGVVGLSALGGKAGFDATSIGFLGSIGTTICSLGMADNIMKYFKFKKMKKQLLEEEKKSRSL